MHIAIIYATEEGHTGKIARFVQRELTDAGHEVSLFDVDAAEPVTLDQIDAVILAAPVHQRRHPRSFEATLEAESGPISRRPCLFLSVSLSAAFPEGRDEAQDYLDEVKMRTGITPSHEACVAGAIRLGRYDYFAMQVLKLVVLRNRDWDPSLGNHDFTDWDALKATIASFLADANRVATR